MRASQVPGVAHLLGFCHACQAPAVPSARKCGTCGATFEIDTDRQFLGLSPVRLLPGHASAEQVAASSLQAPRQEQPRGRTPAAVASSPSPDPPVGASAPVPVSSVPTNPASISAETGAVPADFGHFRAGATGRVLWVAVVLLALVCVALIGVVAVMVFMYPELVQAIRTAAGMGGG